MKVLLIDADSKMPNLALMKISAFHKKQGDEVYLQKGLGPELPLFCLDPDQVYISCIFRKNHYRAIKLMTNLEMTGLKLQVGGTAFYAFDHALPYHIEHIMPDYSLYGIDYSMGFTTRGCIRRCPWCLVPEREGNIKDHASISEFLQPGHKKVILLDNNLLASPSAAETLKEIAKRRLLVNFTQGLDIRLINKGNAQLLARIHYYDRRFKNRRLHFAFDTPEIKEQVARGIETLERNGIPRRHLMFYVLVGYDPDSTFSQDMERIQFLLQQKVLPYIMPYNDSHASWLQHLERWVNGRFYKFIPWEKYDHGNSQQVITAMK